MSATETKRNIANSLVTASGSSGTYRSRTYHFDKYDIVVKLTDDNKFVGIEEVGINKDFRSIKDRAKEISKHSDQLPPE